MCFCICLGMKSTHRATYLGSCLHEIRCRMTESEACKIEINLKILVKEIGK